MNKESADTMWTAEAQTGVSAANTADQTSEAGIADMIQTAFPLWEAVCRHIGDAPYRILYEDEAVLVCCKKAGVPVQSASLRTPDLESMLRRHLADTAQPGTPDRRSIGNAAGKPPYLGLVHRLDQPVAGLLVFAKTKQAAAALSKQAQDGTMQKQYLAVVCGLPKADEPDAAKTPDKAGNMTASSQRKNVSAGAQNMSGVLTDYLLKGKDKKSMSAHVVPPQTPGAKRAVLDYEVLFVTNGKAAADVQAGDAAHAFLEQPKAGSSTAYALLRITLHTGRFHQIRAQLAHADCPIVGDIKYGGAAAKNKTAVCLSGQADSGRNAAAYGGQARGGQLMLCAYRLAFTHPVTKKELTFSLEDEG